MSKPTVKHWLTLALVAGLTLSCGLFEPKEGEPRTNQPPETVLTAYPPDVYTHTVTLRWKGQDSDGIVMYYETSVNGSPWRETTRTDTTIVFPVNEPAGTLHTFAVRAYDDDGAADPTPAECAFTATSIAPQTTLKAAPSSGARVGPAITVELDADDPDDSRFEWRCKIDDGPWTEWRADSTFAFADPSIVEGSLGLLSVGPHTFYGQVRDAAGVMDPTPVTVSFEVIAGTEPTTFLKLSEINGRATYADYSAFTALDGKNSVHFEIAASADAYGGVVAGFASIWCRASELSGAQFSPWENRTVFDFPDVAPGQYYFIFKARDTAGHEDSSPESLFVDIVDPRTDLDPASIVLIQETRNGTGGRGSPSVAQVNEYYAQMLGGRTYTTVNYGDLAARNWFVSPRVAGRAGLILWIDDDSSDHWLFSHPENMRFLREYVGLREKYSLPVRTHLLLSHWNLLGASNVDNEFLSEVFAIATADAATNGNTRDFVAAQGQGALDGTTLTVNGDALPAPFQGKLNKVWALTGPDGATTLTTWVGDPPGALDGRTNAYYYAGENTEVVVTGFPLFFMNNAPAFMDAALRLMGF